MDTNISRRALPSRHKKILSVLIIALAVIGGLYIENHQQNIQQQEAPATSGAQTTVNTTAELSPQKYPTALQALAALAVKGRAPKTGYARVQYGSGWEISGGCSTRDHILARDLTSVALQPGNCNVSSGILNDPYTGKVINFTRGASTSSAIQIDHVVALSDAWQKGAQLLTPALREQMANDSLELLAVDGPSNQVKGDGDAATWLPPNKSFRCSYVARQVSVKVKYSLWVTLAEKTAIQKLLADCPNQPLPT